MPKPFCKRHGRGHPCTCAMGNIYRFIEPVLLLILKQKGRSHGYELSEHLNHHALTDAEIERAAMYRTLRTLETNGYVTSTWQTDSAGPARRVYSITHSGQIHLREWAEVMERLGTAMLSFSKKASSAASEPRTS